VDPGPDLAEVLVGLGDLRHAQGGRIDGHRVDARLRDERIGGHAELLHDVVLQEPVDDDHVGAHQLISTGHPLVERRAVMGDELEVQVGDPDAGVALAGRRLADVAAAPTEAEVAALDRVEQERPVHLLGRRVGERRVALELRQPEARAEGCHDRADEVGQDVLGVVELDAGEVARVAGDVGDQEARGLACGEHSSSLPPVARPRPRTARRRHRPCATVR